MCPGQSPEFEGRSESCEIYGGEDHVDPTSYILAKMCLIWLGQAGEHLGRSVQTGPGSMDVRSLRVLHDWEDIWRGGTDMLIWLDHGKDLKLIFINIA